MAFQLNVTSSETTTTTPKDKLSLEVLDTRGRLLKTMVTFSNLNKSAPGNYALFGNYSLAQFAGQTVRIQFRVSTDSSLLTTFRIDEILVH